MTGVAYASDEDRLGPIDYMVVEFPGGHVSQEGFDVLLDLAERGVIRVLDAEFVARDENGVAAPVAVTGLSSTNGSDLGAWNGASSGLLDDLDLLEIGQAISRGSVAAVVVFENRWVLGVADLWKRGGARLVADGGIDAETLIAALDKTEH